MQVTLTTNSPLPAAPKRPARLRLLAIVTAALLLLGAGVWLLTSQAPRPANSAGGAPTGAASAAPAPAPTFSPAPEAASEDLTEDTADIVLADYFEAMDALQADTDVDSIAPLVTGDALDEVESQLIEFESRNWSLEGQTRYEDLQVLEADLDAETPTATVSVCVDSSDVILVSADGSPVVDDPADVRRAINLYDLAYTDGAWRVTSHTFPNDPQC
jgi:predicted lipid-binding transport protein (Tim44 family)